jgi:hypothetical protein
MLDARVHGAGASSLNRVGSGRVGEGEGGREGGADRRGGGSFGGVCCPTRESAWIATVSEGRGGRRSSGERFSSRRSGPAGEGSADAGERVSSDSSRAKRALGVDLFIQEVEVICTGMGLGGVEDVGA